MKFENNKNLKSQNMFNLLLFSFKKREAYVLFECQAERGGMDKNE